MWHAYGVCMIIKVLQSSQLVHVYTRTSLLYGTCIDAALASTLLCLRTTSEEGY